MRGAGFGRLFASAVSIWLALVFSLTARAQSVEDFYRNKTINLVTGVGPGGEYDIIMRLVARHFSRFMPGRPAVVAQNMIGGSGVLMANWLQRLAPQDGLTFGLMQNSLPTSQVVGQAGLNIDAGKLGWIGSLSPTVEVIVAHRGAGIATIDEAKQRELILGSVGAGGITNIFPKMLNDLLATKIRLVGGYQGGNDIVLAVERGEVGGRVMSWSTLKASKNDWLTDRKVNIIIAAGAKQPDLPGVPRIEELVKTEDELRIVDLVNSGDALGRPFVAPPGVPPERLAALREAFSRMVADEEFRRDAATVKVDVDPTPHDELQRVIERTLSTPRALVERARKYF
jgi:tripartite-type tricarboxylate transporter receptor subunit TctC